METLILLCDYRSTLYSDDRTELTVVTIQSLKFGNSPDTEWSQYDSHSSFLVSMSQRVLHRSAASTKLFYNDANWVILLRDMSTVMVPLNVDEEIRYALKYVKSSPTLNVHGSATLMTVQRSTFTAVQRSRQFNAQRSRQFNVHDSSTLNVQRSKLSTAQR
ncbi:hypothetical protein DICVIV_12613 [Dictyocaulus viviparus]|uniref:Uncharacterized protein n=1 Tax=Dictyocaulus viviparus TaxID=29172 RepID=A0A0D8XCB2_DICVI|nr:hypothetical protein DICVIV_12613 [Dictyocaulus viviparus]